ncbi:MAG: hypothetical protein ABI772_14750, partial [Bacteroidota bacterium]
MKKILLSLLVSCLCLVNQSKAATGDTIIVQAHQNYVINWYGTYNQWTVFPPAGTSFSKILMKYTFSQPQPNTEWDYTTNVFANVITGTYDSTLTQYPYFTMNGNVLDTAFYNTSPVYVYFFNSTTQTTDSAFASTLQFTEYNDNLNPAFATDSAIVYPGNYYNYIYNSSGVVVDSVYVPASEIFPQQFHNIYTVFEVKDPFELGRVMTPYGGYFSASWSFNYWFDVT